MMKKRLNRFNCFLLLLLVVPVVSAQAELSSPAASGLTSVELDGLMASMVWVEGGRFSMGSDSASAAKMERPAHEVSLAGFYLGATEVTQALFLRVMNWDNSYFQCANCPVNNVSWKTIQRFITRLNALTGKQFRLPSEAEWEYAAKGGRQSKGYRFSGSETIGEVAWYAGNAERRAHPVALKQANELGLYDMTGNLWEFCIDDMSRMAYRRKETDNPVVISNHDHQVTSMKVIRGGGYEFSASESELFKRDGATSNVRMPDIGFRLALSKP